MVDVVCLKRGGFGYGPQWVYMGEIFALRGFPNDRRLIDVGYLERYDDSMHYRADEEEQGSHRFISRDARLTYLRQEADEAEVVADRAAFLGQDPMEMETRAIEARGLRVSEQAGPRPTSLAGLPATIECPIEGCDLTFAPGAVGDHILTHSANAESEPEPAVPVVVEPEKPRKAATAKARAKRTRKPAARRARARTTAPVGA